MLEDLLAPVKKNSEAHDGMLNRFIFDVQTGEVMQCQLSGISLELPRINYAYNGSDYAYMYAFAQSKHDTADVANQLVKINVKTGETLVWQESSCYPGEPVFIADPSGVKEDDGAILAVVLDAAKGTSFLLILDAQTFTERARAYAPHHIPFGLHGIFSKR